jgi:hypothetical protein
MEPPSYKKANSRNLLLIAFQAFYQSNDKDTCHGLGKETKLISCQTGDITLLQAQDDSSPKESGLFKKLQQYIWKFCLSI